MTISNASPNKPAARPHNPAATSERQRAVEDAARRKREAEARAPQPGSREARVAEATAPGVVKPSRSDRPTKIPADRNLTKPRVDDTSTATEGDVRDRKKFAGVKDGKDVYVEGDAKRGLDKELDAAVKPKRVVKDPDQLTVGDVARELGLDPKRARARLRASGASAVEGRWPKVQRGSKEHDALVATLSAAETKAADKADEKSS